MVFTNILDENLKTLGGIHEMRKQKIETYLVPRLGPRTSAPASAPVLGPSLGTKWVSIFLIFAFHETTQGFKFSPKNIHETTKKFQKNHETRQKKKSGFYLKPPFLHKTGQ